MYSSIANGYNVNMNQSHSTNRRDDSYAERCVNLSIAVADLGDTRGAARYLALNGISFEVAQRVLVYKIRRTRRFSHNQEQDHA